MESGKTPDKPIFLLATSDPAITADPCQSFGTNIDELNLLGKSEQGEGVRTRSGPTNDAPLFRIDQLNLWLHLHYLFYLPFCPVSWRELNCFDDAAALSTITFLLIFHRNPNNIMSLFFTWRLCNYCSLIAKIFRMGIISNIQIYSDRCSSTKLLFMKDTLNVTNVNNIV